MKENQEGSNFTVVIAPDKTRCSDVVFTEREQWVVDELRKGTPVYVESKTLIRMFSVRFFPENTKKDRYGFRYIDGVDKTKKELQKCLRSLSKKGVIKKKALGVYGAKTDFLLDRNWIWAWTLFAKYKI